VVGLLDTLDIEYTVLNNTRCLSQNTRRPYRKQHERREERKTKFRAHLIVTNDSRWGWAVGLYIGVNCGEHQDPAWKMAFLTLSSTMFINVYFPSVWEFPWKYRQTDRQRDRQTEKQIERARMERRLRRELSSFLSVLGRHSP